MASTNRAIASILSQEPDVEIIVVDDASKEPYKVEDDTHDYSAIKVIRHATNKGPATARNTGMEMATQPLISFLDSDDYLIENTLTLRIEYALQAGILTNEKAQTFIGCSWQETNTAGKVINVRHPKPSTSSDDLFSGCWFCPGSSVIINRDWLTNTKVKFDKNLKRLEDLDLFMRLGETGANYHSQQLVGVSISASDSRYPYVIIEACEAITTKYLENDNRLNQDQRARLKAYLFYELSRAHITKSEYHRALDYLVKSFIQRPRFTLYPGPGWTKSSD